jgi:glutamyl-tRNA synthetase
LSGVVAWDDKVKGRIEISNTELDDLVIARPDGTPTYNFCVVVDDIDMAITHVIRGDDHINNTPRQIHIFRALQHEPPVYAHLPTVLNEQGDKLSKRNGAKPVTQFRDEGFLPEAMVNYLARLGWSHGDDEIFSKAQFVEWFNLDHLGKSAAQFDEAKLRWVNAQHLKAMSGEALSEWVKPLLQAMGVTTDQRLPAMCDVFKDRCDTTLALVDWVKRFYLPVTVSEQDAAQFLTADIQPVLQSLTQALTVCSWDKLSIALVLKELLQQFGLKMPQLAMPVRVLLMGTPQTPSLDAVLALFSREVVLRRLKGV